MKDLEDRDRARMRHRGNVCVLTINPDRSTYLQCYDTLVVDSPLSPWWKRRRGVEWRIAGCHASLENSKNPGVMANLRRWPDSLNTRSLGGSSPQRRTRAPSSSELGKAE
jgi:hypothetical protein